MEKIIQPLSSASDAAPPEPLQQVPTTTVPVAVVAAASLYPEATRGIGNTTNDLSHLYGVAASSNAALSVRKLRLPIGIYIIAGLNILGFILGLINTTSTSGLANATMLIDFAFGVGLLFRFEIVRQITVFCAIISAVLFAFSFLGLWALHARINEAQTKFDQAVTAINPATETIAERQHVDALKAQVADEKAKAGHAINVALGVIAVEFLVASAEAVYLTRPKVKRVFQVKT